MPRGRRIPVEVQREIYRLVREDGFTNAAEIRRYLEKRFPAQDVPSERTIRNVVRELEHEDTSGPWTPGPENDPRHDALVMRLLARRVAFAQRVPDAPEHLRKWSHHRERMTKEQVRWLVWVHTGWPDLDIGLANAIASEYRWRRQTGKRTDDLDAILGFAPWRSAANYRAWEAALDRGDIEEPPFHFYWALSLIGTAEEMLEEQRKSNGRREATADEEEKGDGQAPQGES